LRYRKNRGTHEIRWASQVEVESFVAFSPDNRLLASGDDDDTLAIWEIATGTCLQLLRSDRPYERMNIHGLKGITEAQKASLKALGASEETH
jgi:WD40 repeat protein